MTVTADPLADVSRETLKKLRSFMDHLVKWTGTINLIAPSTIGSAWDRHIIDSTQIFALIPSDARALLDLGSGGGLPGIVIAIMATERRPDLAITLVESDQRKAAFLRSMIREFDLNAKVLVQRIETMSDLQADVVTARALAPLDVLLSFAHRLLHDQGTAIFLKGRSHAAEVEAARSHWTFDLTETVSRTDPDSRILHIESIRRVIA